jgi:exopolysaccharide production protein ExoY
VSSKTLSNAFELPAHDGDSDAAARELARTRLTFNAVLIPDPGLFLRPQDYRQRQTALELVPRQGRLNEGSRFALGGRTKRLLDIVTASTAIVLLAPLMLIVMLLIYATMGRPIFFAQRRIGYRGASFPCLKFRTMVNNAEVALGNYLDQNPDAASEWRTCQKLRHDPRVTILGRLLRQSSIDELPQLISVLQGNMSCVGPRPIIEPEIARYGDYWIDYMRARPGLTGAWQVSGRNRVGYRKRVSLDRWYVRRWSIWLDLWLLAKTIPAVLKVYDTA